MSRIERLSLLEKSFEELNSRNTDLRLRFVELYEEIQLLKKKIAELEEEERTR